jgi:hypothetical protein
MKPGSILSKAFVHACVPPIIIFSIFASALWVGGEDGDFPLTLALFLTGAGGGVISTYFRLKELAPTDVGLTAILQIYITPVIAGLLGWICYAFFLTGVLQGPLFPEFKGADAAYSGVASVFSIEPKTSMDAAKAMLWAFVAGFSEKLIPNILDKLASQVESSGSGNSDKPTGKQ